jgi:drug/metabolite transporter (DMT)-like permease
VVKVSADRLVAAWAVVVVAAVVCLPLLVAVGLPPRRVWWMVAFSSAIHITYNLFLVTAYRHADLAVAYPIARGTAPLLVALGGIALVGDAISPVGLVGLVLITAGLGALVVGRAVGGWAWAVATGLVIAGYTLVDGAGVRATGDSVSFITTVFVVNAVGLSAVLLWFRGPAALRALVAQQPVRLAAGGTASAAAYILVMIAARTEPLGLVSGLRETSAVFGVVLGHRIGERISPRQTAAVVLVALGAMAAVQG